MFGAQGAPGLLLLHAGGNAFVLKAGDTIDLDSASGSLSFTDVERPMTEVAADLAVEACRVCPVNALSAFDADGRSVAP